MKRREALGAMTGAIGATVAGLGTSCAKGTETEQFDSGLRVSNQPIERRPKLIRLGEAESVALDALMEIAACETVMPHDRIEACSQILRRCAEIESRPLPE